MFSKAGQAEWRERIDTMNKLKRTTTDSKLTWAWIDLRFKN